MANTVTTTTTATTKGFLVDKETFIKLNKDVCDLQDQLALIGSGSNLELTDDDPLPDNDGSANKRIAISGSSLTAARSDHKHAIERQDRTLDPQVTVTGTGVTLVAQLILDFESDEEAEYYKLRVQLSRTAGNGWHIINVPFFSSHQEPRIFEIGNYRIASTAVQEDESTGSGGTGASPRGPYMGKEWHEWSSTRRIYGGYFRRDNDIPTEYVEFWVGYTCR